MRRTAPRPLAAALAPVARRVAPATPLASVQERWAQTLGAAIAREAEPVSERGGVLTVACSSATWAHELELLSPDLVAALNEALDRDGHGRPLRELRLVTRSARAGGASSR